MPVKDIRPFKTKMREQSKAWRRSLTAEEKQALDSRIAERLYATWQYRRCRTLLVYVSTAIEVATHARIARALAAGKFNLGVAVLAVIAKKPHVSSRLAMKDSKKLKDTLAISVTRHVRKSVLKALST